MICYNLFNVYSRILIKKGISISLQRRTPIIFLIFPIIPLFTQTLCPAALQANALSVHLLFSSCFGPRPSLPAVDPTVLPSCSTSSWTAPGPLSLHALLTAGCLCSLPISVQKCCGKDQHCAKEEQTARIKVC